MLWWHIFSNTGCYNTFSASWKTDDSLEKCFICNRDILYRVINSQAVARFVHSKHYSPDSSSFIF
jgi:hypothetical protein